MTVDFKQLWRVLGIAILAFILWFAWWSQAERQVRRAQARLLDAVESRDFEALGELMADDYRDQWDHDKANVLRRAPRVFEQFVLLDVEGEIRTVEETPEGWLVAQKIVVKGLGGGLAIYARDEVNSLAQPFTMTWRKHGWKPWDWQLQRIEQPELRIPAGGY